MPDEAQRERYYVSPLNFDPRVTTNEHIRSSLVISDDTLREGQQAAEVAFGPEEEVEIARALTENGVRVAQVGYAGADDATVRRIHAACPELKLITLVVGWKDDAAETMQSARDAGAAICSILFRSTDLHLTNLGYTRERAVDRIKELVRLARDLDYEEVAFTPSFATIADFDFLMRMYRDAIETGASIISLSDSMGGAKPDTIRWMVGQMRHLSESVGIRVHMHNDFGLAVANTLAGVMAGADWIDATVNGLGERTGNCPLEEIVLALEGLYGVETGIRIDGLYELCKLVERLTGVPIPPMKPVAGEDCFSNKLDIHVKAAASNPRLMEPYDPTLVGNRRRIKLGRGTGPSGVAVKLKELGLELPPDAVETAVQQVNERAIATKRAVSDDAFRSIVASIASGEVSEQTTARR